MDQDKRLFRKLKRDVKRAANKRRWQQLNRELEKDPKDAPHSEFDFGRNSSEVLNGMDQDATRRRKPRDEGAG